MLQLKNLSLYQGTKELFSNCNISFFICGNAYWRCILAKATALGNTNAITKLHMQLADIDGYSICYSAPHIVH